MQSMVSSFTANALLSTSGGFSKYAHWGALGSSVLLLILGIVACAKVSLSDSAAGLASILVAILVAFVELSKYVPFLKQHLGFFLEHLGVRALVYVILSIPEFTQGITAAGGVFLLLTALLYGYCWWRGEKGIDTEGEDASSPRPQRMLDEEGGIEMY